VSNDSRGTDSPVGLADGVTVSCSVAIVGVKALQPGKMALSIPEETWLILETLEAILVALLGLNGTEPGGARWIVKRI